MYNLENILPFLDKAPLIRKSRAVYKTVDVLYDPDWFNIAREDTYFPDNKVYDAYLVYPLGKIVLKAPINNIVWLLRNHQYVSCNVYEVDYTKVASVLTIDNDYVNGKKVAQYPLLNGFLNEDIYDATLIAQCTGDYKVIQPSWVGFVNPEIEKTLVGEGSLRPTNEDISLDDVSNIMRITPDRDSDSPYIMRLESYFSGSYTTNRTPLLVGGTAVAKSSVVKALCQKHNMRMVDIRTAFISRLDLEGLSESIDLGDSIESFNCPMDQMVMCTDAYVDYCRAVVPKIRKKIDDLRSEGTVESKEEAVNLELGVLPRFVEGSKIPVLFFDEITRGEKSVRQALTKILSDKAFMGYPMSYARFVAATNSSGSDDDIYLTKSVDDSAFYDRFESMFIYPEDAFPGWQSWAESMSNKHQGTNIHPVIRAYIGGNVSLAYSQDEIMAKYEEDGDDLALTSSPFPNYRTWELVSDYLYKNDETKTYRLKYIEGLIGVTAAKDFVDSEAFVNEGWKEKEESVDKMRDIVEEGFDSGTPTMLIAPSSVGKTARIKKAVKDRGALFIEVNLAEQDRTDLLGFPTKVSINRMILGKDTFITDDLMSLLSEELGKHKLPSQVTIKAPKASVAEQFKKAYATGQDVVIFFDELNRVMNPSTMSVVFDACSDNRIFGVNFDPSRVKIFAACNLGENMADAQPLDPAFAARFSIYKKNYYDEDDARSFLAYAESQEFDPIFLQYLKDLPTESLLNIIKSVEERTLEVSAPSTRGLEDLNKFIKDKEHNGVMSGTVLFPSAIDQTEAKNTIRGNNYNSSVSLLNAVLQKINNWSAVNSNQTLSVKDRNGGVSHVTAEEIKNLVAQCSNLIHDTGKTDAEKTSIINTVLQMAYSLDIKVVESRGKMTSFFMGSYSEDFINYYNKVSGTQIVYLRIEDCADINNIGAYVKQVLTVCKKASDIDGVAFEATQEFYDYFKDSLSVDHYRAWVDSVLSFCINADMKFAYIKNCTMDLAKADKVIQKAENKDAGYIQNILNSLGLPHSIDEIKQRFSSQVKLKPVVLG